MLEDRARWPLWFPVAFGAGIAGYFALPWEPPLGLALAMPLPVVALAWSARGRLGQLWMALGVLSAFLGLAAATVRTAGLDTAMLARPLWAHVTGTVVRIEHRPDDVRLTLADASVVADRTPDILPERVRLVVRTSVGALRLGDRIRLRARLTPPPPPSVPGGFDFQRHAYFDGLGAVGFAIGAPEVLSGPRSTGPVLAVDGVRAAVAARLTEGLPGPAGSVAAALLVGDRSGLDEDTVSTFRDSGLAHLLAISGLHMGLVAGTVFAVLRFALCLIPRVALRWPVKQIAAAAALVVSAGYLVLAGAPVPTQRAFVMTGIVLTAILAGREAVTMRLVALAAVAVLALRPEALVGASFQLSFAAVIALVVGHEAWRRRRPRENGSLPGWLTGPARYTAGVALTSVIATVATAPFVTFHFQAVALGGLAANLAAVPLTGFLTMPAGIVALLLMPFGGEAPALAAMGHAIEATLWVATRVVDVTGPAAGLQPLPVAGLSAVAIGGCWIAIWRGRLRWLGGFPILAGLVSWLAVSPPDVLISADGRLGAIAADDVGGWAVTTRRGNGFSRSVWARRWGVTDAVTLTALDLRRGGEEGRLTCDDLGCVLRRDGRMLSLVTSHEAALEDCLTADVVIALVKVRTPCGTPSVVIHRPDLMTAGAHAVWLGPGEVRVESVGRLRGDRPWIPGRRSLANADIAGFKQTK